MKTQCERILKYMHDFGSITSLDAIRDLGVMRLASRICDLRKAGYDIVSEDEQGKNRYGETTHFTRYRLRQDKLELENESHIPVI